MTDGPITPEEAIPNNSNEQRDFNWRFVEDQKPGFIKKDGKWRYVGEPASEQFGLMTSMVQTLDTHSLESAGIDPNKPIEEGITKLAEQIARTLGKRDNNEAERYFDGVMENIVKMADKTQPLLAPELRQRYVANVIHLVSSMVDQVGLDTSRLVGSTLSGEASSQPNISISPEEANKLDTTLNGGGSSPNTTT
jgi:hypothetical protein